MSIFDLMDDMDKIRAGELEGPRAMLLCRHANVIMKSENAKLQYVRVQERIDRNGQLITVNVNGSVTKPILNVA